MLIDSLIPTEMAIAPNALGLMPNLQLQTIPVDANTAFELWAPISHHCILLAEEAALLRNDFVRIEYICDRLLWLLGGVLMDDTAARMGEPIYQWAQILELVQTPGHRPDLITVAYQPQVIGSVPATGNGPKGWLIQPAHWKISFLQLKPIGMRYQAAKIPFELVVALGQPITRCVKNMVA